MSETRAQTGLKGRFVLGFFVLASISAWAQPCQMPVEAPSPASAHHMVADAHAGHGPASDGDVPAGCHCPPGAEHDNSGCTGGIDADCGSSDEFSADSRTKTPSPKDAVKFVAMPEPPGSEPGAMERLSPVLVPAGELKHSTAPALSIQYCVFLK